MTEGEAAITSSPADVHAVEVASYLWQEYSYRHDMIWKLAFRVTAVAAALLIAPFLADESVQERVENGLVALPILAVVVILAGLFVLRSELERFDQIKRAYRQAQNDALKHLPPSHWTPNTAPGKSSRWRPLPSEFDRRVNAYLIVLLILALGYCGYFAYVWL